MKNGFVVPRLLSLFLFAIVLWSCQKQPYFIHHSDIPHDRWDSRDTLVFEVPGMDFDNKPVFPMTLSACVRYTDEYKYRKVVLGVEVYNKESRKLIKTGTLSYTLYDEKARRRGNGTVYLESETQSLDFEMNPYNPYLIKVFHKMRLDPLEGISNVVIQVDGK